MLESRSAALAYIRPPDRSRRPSVPGFTYQTEITVALAAPSPYFRQSSLGECSTDVYLQDSDSPKDQWMRQAEDILELVSAALSFLSASGPLTVTLDSKHSWFPWTHVIVETTFRIFRRAPVDPDPSFYQVRLGGWLAKFYRWTSSKIIAMDDMMLKP
ncbi:hypothetical protein C8J56DRAFT_1103635 [Mycena floridula]|nr:hypothetical protein C8J56DRAFT_1124985 [Mycena floridula]KAJ7580581.1 hypothetical protein C8J56DRAFT_1103635 [Mycena floridula]